MSTPAARSSRTRCVAAAEAVQHEGDTAIGDERRDAEHAHHLDMRQRAMQRMPNRAAEHPQRKCNQSAALDDSCPGAPAKSRARHTEADRVVRRIAEEIECIGLQRGRASRHAGEDLGEEEAGIDAECNPKRAPPVRTVQRFSTGAVVIAATSHGVLDKGR